jgi:DNA-binding MarR family transcriptional regulator
VPGNVPGAGPGAQRGAARHDPDDPGFDAPQGEPLRAGPALVRVSTAISDIYDQVSAHHGLTRQQSRMLFVLHARPTNMLGLGAELNLVKSTMTGVVARMEDAGWVQRTADPRDRRNAVLTLTPEGAQLAGRFQTEMGRRMLDIIAPLDADDRALLGSLLSRVIQRIEELHPPE